MSSVDWGTDHASGLAGPGSQQSGGSPTEPGGPDPSGDGGPAGRRTLIVGVLAALFVVALGWFVVRPMMTGATDVAAAAPAPTSAGASTPAATPTPSPSDTATQSAPPTAAETGNPRNPFVSPVTPSASGSESPTPSPTGSSPATPTATPTSESPAPPQSTATGSTQAPPASSPQATSEVPLGLGEGSSPGAGYQAPAQADGAEGAVSPHGTLALTTISSEGGSVTAVMTWNGKTYRAQPGEQFTKYLTLVDVAGNQALFSYRDKPFALGLHQKRTF